jgi:hypothetical protein
MIYGGNKGRGGDSGRQDYGPDVADGGPELDPELGSEFRLTHGCSHKGRRHAGRAALNIQGIERWCGTPTATWNPGGGVSLVRPCVL